MALCIASGCEVPGNPIADCKITDPIADGKHAPRAFNAEHFRIRRFSPRHALAHTNVQEVHTRGCDFDDDMSRRHDRLRAIDAFHHVGAADLIHNYSFHGVFLFLTECSKNGQNFTLCDCAKRQSTEGFQMLPTCAAAGGNADAGDVGNRNSATASEDKVVSTSPAAWASPMRLRAASLRRRSAA